VSENGEWTVTTSWTLAGTPPSEVRRGPPAGIRRIYIVDDRGRRHEPYGATPEAKRGGSGGRDGDRLEGGFLFRMPQPSSSRFNVHDDDHALVIRGLILSRSRRTTMPEDRQLVRQKVFAAREVEIIDSWGGLGKPRYGRWSLRGGAAGFAGDAKVPGEVARRFLELLAETPVLRASYEPALHCTDDYPYLSILLGVGADTVAFFTESQGRGHAPWGVRTYTAVFVAPSDRPARALEVLRPYLGEPRGATKLVELLRSRRGWPRAGPRPGAP
jgi:hypothetical protein